MFVASKTTRTLKNEVTGMDISVPSVQEVEAPLGGISIEYEISVVTNLPMFKGQLHKDDDTVRYSLQRAYREIEDFYGRVEKKYRDVTLPSIPRGRSIAQHSSEEKRTALDKFMQYIAQNEEICQSTILSNFLGICKLKPQKSDTCPVNYHQKSSDVSVSSATLGSSDHGVESQSDVHVLKSLENDDDKSLLSEANNEIENHSDVQKREDGISELFPKVKVRKSSKPECMEEEIISHERKSSAPAVFKSTKEKSLLNDDLDLFEEAKQVKKIDNKEESLFASDRKFDGLFGDFDEDVQLFSKSEPAPVREKKDDNLKTSLQAQPMEHMPKENDAKEKTKSKDLSEELSLFNSPSSSGVRRDMKDSSELFTPLQNAKPKAILNDDEFFGESKTFGNVSLFGEQDFTSGITEDDEKLFFVAKQKVKKTVSNPFLSPTTEGSSQVNDVGESLEELLNLPEPSAVVLSKPEPPSEEDHVPLDASDSTPTTKPVAPPRTKPSSSQMSESVETERPQVASRRVFMSKPSLPPKPVPPPKPKKPTDVAEDSCSADLSRTKPPKPAAKPSVAPKPEVKKPESKSKIDDLTSFDIMQYIEQEQKAAGEGASLFD